MAVADKHILIVGGGFSGMSAAIQLCKGGAHVDLLEIDPHWRPYGAGITVSGPTLRAFRTLGVLDAFLERGYASDGTDIHTPEGHQLAKLQNRRLAGPDIPGTGGIMRTALADILAEATRQAGARVILGQTFERLEEAEDGVTVTFMDGTRTSYDLVIGADGIGSKVRATIFPDAPQATLHRPGPSGAPCLPRPPEIANVTMWLGRNVKIGVTPVSSDLIYMFVAENRRENTFVDPAGFLPLLSDMMADFSAPVVQTLRAALNETSQIVYRPLEALLLPRPWSKGHIVLIGDSVHATTPHLASGACIGIEDAIVLAEQLENNHAIEDALPAFEARRFETLPRRRREFCPARTDRDRRRTTCRTREPHETDGDDAGRGNLRRPKTRERFPVRWSHLTDKKSLSFQRA